nr:hypothetical protein [Tanacetum cinerariifolium]GEZ86637.1 hypothetical protein [Tanacetum cinerariifolium]
NGAGFRWWKSWGVVIEAGNGGKGFSRVGEKHLIHAAKTDMMKLVVEIECFNMSFDEFDKETGSSDGLQPKQADLSCVHALNKPH